MIIADVNKVAAKFGVNVNDVRIIRVNLPDKARNAVYARMRSEREKEAKAKGLKRFFTGIPCKKANHISERLCCNKGCIKCMRISENRRRRGEKIEIIQRECKSDKCNFKFEVKETSNQIYCSPKCRSYYTSKLERTLFPEKTRVRNNRCFEKHGAKYNFKRSGKRGAYVTQ